MSFRKQIYFPDGMPSGVYVNSNGEYSTGPKIGPRMTQAQCAQCGNPVMSKNELRASIASTVNPTHLSGQRGAQGISRLDAVAKPSSFISSNISLVLDNTSGTADFRQIIGDFTQVLELGPGPIVPVNTGGLGSIRGTFGQQTVAVLKRMPPIVFESVKITASDTSFFQQGTMNFYIMQPNGTRSVSNFDLSALQDSKDQTPNFYRFDLNIQINQLSAIVLEVPPTMLVTFDFTVKSVSVAHDMVLANNY